MKRKQENGGKLLVTREDRYRQMVAEIQDYAIITLDRDGFIQDWNIGAQNITLFKTADAIGKHYRQFYLSKHPDDSLPENLLSQVAETGSVSFEAWRLRKDGTTFWSLTTMTALHDTVGELTGFAEVARDMTAIKTVEQRQKEIYDELHKKNEALVESEQRFQQMIAEIRDYAIIVLDEQGFIRNWNTGAELIKGYSSEVIGQHFSIFYPHEDRKSGLPEILLQEATVNGRAAHEGWRVRKDKSRFWGSIVITSLHDKNGNLIGFTKITRDLTERKLAEDKLRAYAAALETRNKELEQFTYITSHDLQEPVRKIRMFAETAGRSANNPQALRLSLERIDAAAERMSALIRSLVDYTELSRDNAEKADVNLNNVLEEVRAAFAQRLEEANATITSSRLPAIVASHSQISQLFFNIIDNALKFSDDNPVLTISADVVDRRDLLDGPDDLREGKYHELRFADNGIGFDQQYHNQIFSIFRRLHTNDSYPGTGTGLALSKKILENHRGHITVRSEPGKGATFFVYLPV